MSLGEQLRKAIERLRNTSSLDKDTVKESVKDIQRALISADVEINTVLALSKKIEEAAFSDLPPGLNRREHVIKTTYDFLAEILGGTPTVPAKPKRILLCGLYGSGKTTSTIKLARWYAKRGMKVVVIAADTFRPAAFDQLKQLSEKAKIDFFGIEKEKNPAKIMQEALNKFRGADLLICDSAGRSALDNELVNELKDINKVFQPEEKWLVISADLGQVAKKQAQAFHDAVGINGVIITKTDGSGKGGGALAACRETNSRVYFIGTGEKIDDFEEFDAQRYLGRIMGYGDLQALLEKAKQAQEEEGLDLEGMIGDRFSLETFYAQLKAARKMGPLNKVMEMAGLSQSIPKEAMEIGEEKLDGFKTMIDSMTKKERENPDLLNKSRISRIAKGSGKKEEDVRELLKNFRNMEKMFKQFKNLNEEKLQKGGINSLLKKLQPQKKKKFRIR